MDRRDRGVALFGGCATGVGDSAVGTRPTAGPPGHYRGWVVSAGTQAPLSGAVVVAVWPRREARGEPRGAGEFFLGLQEAVTTAEGRFVLDGTRIETATSPPPHPPWFVVVARGYAARYPSAATPDGVPTRN